jgi:signal transduction histidine kinase
VDVYVPRADFVNGERFLLETADLLASSLDYDKTLAAIAQLAVRSLADFCVIDLVEDETIRRAQVAHADPGHAELTAELLNFPLDRERPHMSLRVLESGESVLVPDATADVLESHSQSPEHLRIIQALQPRSIMAVPLRARGRLLGVALFVSSSRNYDVDDLALAERFGRIAALEVDNARQYRGARQAVAARDRVLGIVAHDLRNPLNTIVMAAELLSYLDLPAEKRDHQIDVILSSARRMNRLIQDLLTIATIEADRMPLQRELLSPSALAHEAVELAAQKAASRSIGLRAVVAGEVPLISADGDRLLQVLSNLIDNAIRFTPEGGEVAVRVESTRYDVQFAVADNGCGIPSEDLPFIFDSFWRRRGQTVEGAGLGLAIAKAIVEAHGGSIGVDSVVGKESTFHFSIPL